MPQQRLVDFAIGISVLGWAVAGTWSNLGQHPLPVLLAISLLHLTVAMLFFIRSRAATQGDLRTCLMAIPAVLVGGWVFRFAPQHWNLPSQVLFVIGSGLAITSFLFLGRCFAVLPAIRGTVISGPFKIVRHPAYLGELLMVVACVFAVPLNWTQPAVLVVVTLFFVVRIRAEENLLLAETRYQTYAERVRWRLVPLIW